MLRRVAPVRSDDSKERRFLQEPNGVTSQKTAFFRKMVIVQKYNSCNNVPSLHIFRCYTLDLFMKSQGMKPRTKYETLYSITPVRKTVFVYDSAPYVNRRNIKPILTNHITFSIAIARKRSNHD
jgi:hypothetical protein